MKFNIGSILFFLMLVFPYQLTIFKFAIILCILILLIQKDRSISKSSFNWSFLFLYAGIFYIYYGAIKGNSGVSNYFGVHIIWIIMYISFMFFITSKTFFCLIKVLDISFLVILIFGFIAYISFNFLGFTSSVLGFDYTVRPGYPFVAISSGSIISTIFIYPYILTRFILKRDLKIFFLSILGFIFIVFTSRRSLMLNFLLIPFFMILFVQFLKKQQRKKILQPIIKGVYSIIILICLFLFINIYTEWLDVQEFVEFFFNAFKLVESIDEAVDNSSYMRALQMKSLIEGWLEYPFMGSGTAANASVIRSSTPGAYEVSYLALLFHRGLLGLSLYFSQLIYIIIVSLKYLRKNSELGEIILPLLVGYSCFLVANGTNPYLEAYDHLWVLFLPLNMINLLKIDPSGFYKEFLKYKGYKKDFL